MNYATAEDPLHPARWWHREGERFRCDLCPRRCLMSSGQRGFCYVRRASEAGVHLTTWGRHSGFCVDPVEKKPLNHFLPGTAVLSLGTAGCNLGCRHCHNYQQQTARSWDRLSDRATPRAVAARALALGCSAVAFGYNEPIVFAEYALDIALACREVGLRTIAVTNGFVTPAARAEFFTAMDAVNIDLKAPDDASHRSLCLAAIAPVLDTVRYVARETDTWLELTGLLIPGVNDTTHQIDTLTRWIRAELGADVPLHLTRFAPAHRLAHLPPTPTATLSRARLIARANGLNFVYSGNVLAPHGGETTCPRCGHLLIERHGYEVEWYALDGQGRCISCELPIPGRFQEGPGHWRATADSTWLLSSAPVAAAAAD